jgi:heptosyltransferase I
MSETEKPANSETGSKGARQPALGRVANPSQAASLSHTNPCPRILVVRLGAMGDLIHTLPAVASLKNAFPGARLTWAVEPRWAPLLEGNPAVDRIALLRRGTLSGLAVSWRELRAEGYDFAIDFQGLIKSALVAACAGPEWIFGFDKAQVRERAAALFYSRQVFSPAAHIVDRNLDLAAEAGGARCAIAFPLPPGTPEGDLPDGDFVLASPLAGWRSKQWPLERYARLAELLRDIPLVLNAPPGADLPAPAPGNMRFHFSGLPGLIHATRRAAAVVGVDSGPLHLAAALGKPGAALFGPTDPARNGPHGGSLRVLRHRSAATTYKRREAIDASMLRISPEEVLEALKEALAASRPAAERPA